MKAPKIIFIFALALLTMAGCKHKPSVGLLMDTLQTERWEKDMTLIEQKVKEMGGTCTVAIANSDANKQLEQAKEMIDNGVEVLIVVAVDSKKACEIVNYAHKNRVPVISYDRLIKDCMLDYYIATDNIEIGELQANYLTRIKPTGKYGIIGGSIIDNNAHLLYLGQMNVLQPLVEKGDIEIVFSEFSDSWALHEGYKITNNYLNQENAELDAVIAGNDDLAAGVISALKEHNMGGKVLVAGQDAELQAIRNIVGGNQTITIYKPIESMAHAAANAAIKIAHNKAPSDMNLTINNGKHLVPAILLPAQVVHRQNIKMTVVSEGFIEEEEIN
ncbi:xylose-binding protein [Saccharicrinis carchari]|uniref:Xylose-binding protein n=1 Tax=Saccharicrinis carchari TaxID=1168039 RepID=A0A521BCV6_SACCC|nr:substrate-binding domain-containing protein [Saccharicrinis carchari]SMO44811.1 xylose-binding protein [Saccharicrinis carchari]